MYTFKKIKDTISADKMLVDDEMLLRACAADFVALGCFHQNSIVYFGELSPVRLVEKIPVAAGTVAAAVAALQD